MAKRKRSNSDDICSCSPFATGGGGFQYEYQVLASYVVLLLTKGYVPMYPNYIIEEIRPQANKLGYSTDDFLIRLTNGKEKVRLLGQIKHSLAIQKSNKAFKESIEDAWKDYNDQDLFVKGTDKILIITDTLNQTDYYSVLWLLEKSRKLTQDDFFEKINVTNVTPSKTKEKIEVFKNVIEEIKKNYQKEKNAIGPISDNELYKFLQHLIILRYDLLREESVVLSLLLSHISQINKNDDIESIWLQIKEYASTMDICAGIINKENIPQKIKNYFITSKEAQIETQQQEESLLQNFSFESIKKESYMQEIVPALLLGSWNEFNPTDVSTVKFMINGDYDIFIENLHKIEHLLNSPFNNTHSIWTVQNPKILFQQLKSWIYESNIKRYEEIALQLFQKESFRIQQDNGNTPPSKFICNGIATTLAILCSPEISLNKLPPDRIKTIANNIISSYGDANIKEWAYIEEYLPLLAEASPDYFLNMLRYNIKSDSSTIKELFIDKYNSNYHICGIVRSLEILAWSPEYFQCACDILTQLASIDNGNVWGCRPINSLQSILMPRQPHTLASISDRITALRSIVSKYPDFAWGFLLDLLPYSRVMTIDTAMPKYFMSIPENVPFPTDNDIQLFYYAYNELIAQLAVNKPSADWKDFLTILPRFDEKVFNGFIENLQDNLRSYTKEEKNVLWETLLQYINKHKKYPTAKWAMSQKKIEALEKIVKRLKPRELLKKHKILFSGFSHDLVPTKSDLDYDQYIKILGDKQKEAIQEIYNDGGLKKIIEFVHIVKRPGLVGHFMGVIGDSITDQYLLTNHLDTKEICEKEFLEFYFDSRLQATDGKWIDTIDHQDWTLERKVAFLCYMPFYDYTWTIVDQWLGDQKKRYWEQVKVNGYSRFINNQFAVDNLLACQRYDVTLTILWGWTRQDNSNVKITDVIQALINLKAWDNEHTYIIPDMIEYLQQQPNIDMDAMFDIELKYYPDTYINLSYAPIFIEKKLIMQPKLFCKYLTLIFKPDNPDKAIRLNEEERIIAKKFYRIFDDWLTIPGTNTDGVFSPKKFQSWFKSVYTEAAKIGYTKRIKNVIGSILTKAPADEDGFWIHHTIAKILNQINMKDMRDGYYLKKTGVYCWTCSEKFIQEEQKKHDHYIELAKDSENKGYGYLAELLKKLAAFHQGKISDIKKRLEKHKEQYGE